MINRELDIKILILYVLYKLPSWVDYESLFDVVSENDIGYFDYSDCLADLVENGNISRDENGIRITELGCRNAEEVVSELPYSVRKKTDKLMIPLINRIKRMQMISADTVLEGNNTYAVLSMSDDEGEIINLKLLVSDEKQSEIIKKKFKNNAEKIYKEIVELLS